MEGGADTLYKSSWLQVVVANSLIKITQILEKRTKDGESVWKGKQNAERRSPLMNDGALVSTGQLWLGG